MTPIEQMAAAAQQHPKLTQELMRLKFADRERYVGKLKVALEAEGKRDEIETLFLINGHVEIMTQAQLRR